MIQRELLTSNLITLEDELANALYIQLGLPYEQNLKWFAYFGVFFTFKTRKAEAQTLKQKLRLYKHHQKWTQISQLLTHIIVFEHSSKPQYKNGHQVDCALIRQMRSSHSITINYSFSDLKLKQLMKQNFSWKNSS